MEGSISGSSGRRLQIRQISMTGWTRAKRQAFLDVLAATCNVSVAAKAVGLDRVGAYRLRRRDPQFADLWRSAILTGYDRLEEKLLQHLGAGVNDVEVEVTDVAEPPFDPRLALDALRHHRPTVEKRRKQPIGRIERATREEAEAALLRKLEKLAERLEREMGGGT